MFSYVFLSVLIEKEKKVEFEPQNIIKIFLLRLNIHLFTRQTIAYKISIKIIKFPLKSLAYKYPVS